MRAWSRVVSCCVQSTASLFERHPWLLAVATELFVGGIGWRLFWHGKIWLSKKCNRCASFTQFLLHRAEFHRRQPTPVSAPLSTGVDFPTSRG